jgi:hypothetical protein
MATIQDLKILINEQVSDYRALAEWCFFGGIFEDDRLCELAFDSGLRRLEAISEAANAVIE